MAQQVSRFWERRSGRAFYPQLATRYFDAAGKQTLVINDLISITQVSVSDDNGATYTNLTVDTDYWATVWGSSTDSVQDNPLAAGATLVTVSDADGLDQLGFSPRFQAGQLLRCESEYWGSSSVDATL